MNAKQREAFEALYTALLKACRVVGPQNALRLSQEILAIHSISIERGDSDEQILAILREAQAMDAKCVSA